MSTAAGEPIRSTRHGSVATIWLDRPSKRNAMSYAMWAELGAHAARLGDDPDVRVVVLRGAGGHFCAGADITELTVKPGSGERAAGEATFAEVNLAAENTLAALPKPTVAYITGDCIGGGCAMAIDCDLRLATPDARFGITPAKLGIVYPAASLERATQLLGPSVTKRLLFTGDLIDAEEARHVGLVDEIVDGEAGEQRLATLTGVLATRSLLTQAATKSMVAAVLTHGHVPADLQEHWARVAATAGDGDEGIAAFVGKRAARFTWSGPGDPSGR